MLYADVILPLPLHGAYTYAIPASVEHPVQVGSRVVVQFGKKKFYTGIVLRIHKSLENKEVTIKEVVTTLESHPIIPPLQLQLWQWIASYYMCTLGDVYKAAMPAALKLESETFVLLNPHFEAEEPLTPNEQKIFYLLSEDKALKINEIIKASGIANPIPVVKSLVDKQAAYISENIKNTYTAKTQSAVRLKKQLSDEELHTLLNQLQKAPKQQHLLSVFIALGNEMPSTVLTKKHLLEHADASATILNQLVAKDILEIYQYQINRIHYGSENADAAHSLNPHQEKAYTEIIQSFASKDVTLLHGVTGSGKTEIYIRLIQEAIDKEGQVLYLLPEIALTTQITERLKAVFGNKLAVYHSRFSDNERAEVWNKLLAGGECKVILGARSAVFLPFTALSLVIVDEEHESSYKQHDPAPRYNARNTAIVLAGMCHAKTLLGSATPAIETYHSATTGRYGLVALTQRFGDIQLPAIIPVNTKELRRIKQMKSILSPPLIEQMKEALENKKQVILFQNRRDFHPCSPAKPVRGHRIASIAT